MKYAETYVIATEGAKPRLYVCPRDCEHGKFYSDSTVQRCPVCASKLYEFRDGKIEHSSHRPQHNGVFFMAPDGWHHVEGVRVSESEIRIYLYNNFTEPLVEQATASAVFVRTEEKGRSNRSPMSVALQASTDGTYLSGAIPSDYSGDVAAEIRVWFEGRHDAALFNMTFPRYRQSE